MNRETTPNGNVIEFYEQPKRLYRINGAEVPSVTTVLGCLDKPGLPWWGMRIGAEGIISLLEQRWSAGESDEDILTDPVAALTKAKATVNHVRDAAGDRGTEAHDALEAYMLDGTEPDPDSVAPARRGYHVALREFLRDANPIVQDVEVMVGYEPTDRFPGFAGRYDLRATIEECELVVRSDTGQREVFPAGSVRWDAKTPKGIYGSHFLQLDGYELGAIACGYEPTDYQCVIRLGADGKYEIARNTAPPGSFLRIVHAYQAVKDAEPKRPRKRTVKA